MKVTIARSELLRALSRVRGAIDESESIPILNNTLLRVNDADFMEFVGTNFTMETRVIARAKTHVSGSITVPVETFYNITQQLPANANVVLDASADSLRILAGRAKFKLRTLPEANFSLFPDDDLTLRRQINVSKKEVERMLSQVMSAISQEDHRVYLTGVYIHLQDDVMYMVATDGHKLAQSGTLIPSIKVPDIIVPRSTIAELLSLLSDSKLSEISLQSTKSLIRFTIGDTILTSKVIDGTFPDYTRVIPYGNDKVIEVDRVAFGQVIARVSALIEEQGHGIVLETGSGIIKISMEDPNYGNLAEEEMDAEYFHDEFINIRLNATYLRDIVDKIPGETLTIKIAHAVAPILISAKEAKYDLHVLMPMRL